MHYQTVDTPAIVIDETIVEQNIAKHQNMMEKFDFKVRPHIKTHKLTSLAQAQLDAGAVGITCQKISEAEVFVEAGIKNILLTYNILGEFKLKRLMQLAQRCDLTVVADNEIVLNGLNEAAKAADLHLNLLIESDTGMGRCGVQGPESVLEFAKKAEQASNISLKGFMTYPKANDWQAVEDFCSKAKQLLLDEIGHCEVVSVGGTPFIQDAGIVKSATEFRAGTYIYNDASLLANQTASVDECALSVLCTIISIPTENRFIIDAGSKSLTSDLFGIEGYGYIKQYPEAKITAVSEEHGHVDFSDCSKQPEIGEKVEVIPNHVCPVSNLYDEVNFYRDGMITKVEKVEARGKVF